MGKKEAAACLVFYTELVALLKPHDVVHAVAVHVGNAHGNATMKACRIGKQHSLVGKSGLCG